MQRFDKYLGFTLRACNQKKTNRNTSYEIDRLSRYVKSMIKRNIAFACESVESWIKLERTGKLKKILDLPRYYKTKAILSDVNKFGRERFFKLLRESKIQIPERDCSNIKVEELDKLLSEVLVKNTDNETGVWGNDTSIMRNIVGSIGELLSFSEVAFDHTPIGYGGVSKAFTRAPRGASDVYISQSSNSKLAFTYVLCCSKMYGCLDGYYLFPDTVISKAQLKDLQNKGIIKSKIR